MSLHSQYIQSLRNGDPITVTNPITQVTEVATVTADTTQDDTDNIILIRTKLCACALIITEPEEHNYGCAHLGGDHWIVHIPEEFRAAHTPTAAN